MTDHTTCNYTIGHSNGRVGQIRSEPKSHAGDDISAALFAVLGTSEVYLRLGLTRGWRQHPDRCYLQITGVHTFPDYLDGRCFADFAPDQWGWER